RRRRHTSFSRDWSSDVCSSDLGGDGFRHVTSLFDAAICNGHDAMFVRHGGALHDGRQLRDAYAGHDARRADGPWSDPDLDSIGRSEERRVGEAGKGGGVTVTYV